MTAVCIFKLAHHSPALTATCLQTKDSHERHTSAPWVFCCRNPGHSVFSTGQFERQQLLSMQGQDSGEAQSAGTAALLDAALHAITAGDLGLARQRLAAVLERGAAPAEALNLLATIAMQSGDFPAAVAHLQQLAGIANDDPEVLLRLADAAVHGGDSVCANDTLARIVARGMAPSDLILLLSNMAEQRGGTAAALKAAQSGTMSFADDAVLWCFRGKLEWRSKLWAAARVSFENSIRLHPDQPEVVSSLIPAARQTGQLAETAGFLLKTLPARKDFAEHFLLLARLLTAPKPLLAEELYLTALRLDSGNRAVVSNLAVFYVRLDRNRDAIDVLLEFCNRFPLNYDLVYKLGILQHRVRDYNAAIVSMEKLQAVPEQYAGLDAILGDYYCRAGRFDEADAAFSRIPSNSLNNNNKSAVYFMKSIQKKIASITPEQSKELDAYRLPDRQKWPSAQRYEWGLAVNKCFQALFLQDQNRIEELTRFMLPFDMRKNVGTQADGRGSLVFLIHTGMVSMPINLMISSGLPYKLVTNSTAYSMKFRDRIIDTYSPNANTLLAQVKVSLQKGENVMVAIDGMLGKRVREFTCNDMIYSMAAGPIYLGYQARVRTCLVISHYEDDHIKTVFTEGPVRTADMTLLEYQDQWFTIFRREIERVARDGPENSYKHHAALAAKAPN